MSVSDVSCPPGESSVQTDYLDNASCEINSRDNSFGRMIHVAVCPFRCLLKLRGSRRMIRLQYKSRHLLVRFCNKTRFCLKRSHPGCQRLFHGWFPVSVESLCIPGIRRERGREGKWEQEKWEKGRGDGEETGKGSFFSLPVAFPSPSPLKPRILGDACILACPTRKNPHLPRVNKPLFEPSKSQWQKSLPITLNS